MKRDRNLNPRPTAVFAMFHWPNDYAAQRGGVTDFFDELHPADQAYCNDAVTAIVNAASAWGERFRAGRETGRKSSQPVPRRSKKRPVAAR